jgi:hypothetical protein
MTGEDSEREREGSTVPSDANPGTETWGRCAPCERWFYCGHAEDSFAAAICPVCAAAPVALEQRLVEIAS